MRRHFVVVFGLAALVLVFVLAAGTLSARPSFADGNADNDFTDRSLKGSWGFSAHGVILEDDEVIHGVAVGLFSFDGKGECSSSITANFWGESFTDTTEDCTYEVNSDGTGTITIEEEEGEDTTLAFVLVDEAEEFHFITLGPAVFSGVAQRQ